MLHQTEGDLEFDYVETAATTLANWLSEEPAISRQEVMGRFQVANDVIWSPEIYHRINAALNKRRRLPGLIYDC